MHPSIKAPLVLNQGIHVARKVMRMGGVSAEEVPGWDVSSYAAEAAIAYAGLHVSPNASHVAPQPQAGVRHRPASSGQGRSAPDLINEYRGDPKLPESGAPAALVRENKISQMGVAAAAAAMVMGGYSADGVNRVRPEKDSTPTSSSIRHVSSASKRAPTVRWWGYKPPSGPPPGSGKQSGRRAREAGSKASSPRDGTTRPGADAKEQMAPGGSPRAGGDLISDAGDGGHSEMPRVSETESEEDTGDSEENTKKNNKKLLFSRSGRIRQPLTAPLDVAAVFRPSSAVHAMNAANEDARRSLSSAPAGIGQGQGISKQRRRPKDPWGDEPKEQFYFPLESFDDPTFEEPGAMSRSVYAYMRRPKTERAHSRWFFQDGSFEWRPVRVVDQKQSTVGDQAWQYCIQWEATGREKWVSRFNLLFEGEDESLLQERRAVAYNNRREAESALVRDVRIRSIPLSAAAAMPKKLQDGILARVGTWHEKVRVPGSHARKAVSIAKAAALRELEQEYASSMNRLCYEAASTAVVSSVLAAAAITSGSHEVNPGATCAAKPLEEVLPPGVGVDAKEAFAVAVPEELEVAGDMDPEEELSWFKRLQLENNRFNLHANPYTLRAIYEVRGYVVKLAELELFKIWHSLPGVEWKKKGVVDKADSKERPAVGSSNTAAASEEKKTWQRKKEIEPAFIEDTSINIDQFQSIQASARGTAMDLIDHVLSNSANIITDCAADQAASGRPVERECYARLVGLVNCMMQEKVQHAVFQNLWVARLVFEGYMAKVGLSRATAPLLVVPDEVAEEDDREGSIYSGNTSFSNARSAAEESLGPGPCGEPAHVWLEMVRTLPPLFATKLCVQQGELEFDPPLEQFVGTVENSVGFGMEAIDDVKSLQVYDPVVDAACIGGSDFGVDRGPSLPITATMEHPLVREMTGRMREVFLASMETPRQFATAMREFTHVLSDPGKIFLMQFRNSAQNYRDWEDAIANYRKEKAEILALIPKRYTFGVFQCDIEELRTQLADGAAAHATALLDAISNDMATLHMNLIGELQGRIDELSKPLTNLDEVYRCKTAIVAGRVRVDCLAAEQEQLEEMSTLLETFRYGLSDEMVGDVWQLKGLPSKLLATCELREAELPNEEELLIIALHDRRAKFKIEIYQLEQLVEKWEDRDNLEEADEQDANVNKVMKKLDEAAVTAAAINADEKLVSQEQTSYTTIDRLKKMLQPYQNLWRTAHLFTKSLGGGGGRHLADVAMAHVGGHGESF
ncbi:hypothetical protein CYMTET_33704 [Cymbomonas tetramitiformis]|uniref:Uncharacterized protein n=1 Tax=Cymbomonas tetramitiformis TaxID=36881 RepID=A0AAE0FCL4_9CHLO|nr:hypothetical protein CYMTET_33704 [Cymbomonas tetramitiformis]